jgi:hypothetical protein
MIEVEEGPAKSQVFFHGYFMVSGYQRAAKRMQAAARMITAS